MSDIIADELDRMEREPDVRFADVVQAGLPIVGQIEAWAQAKGVQLDEYWKVPRSIKVKQRMLIRGLNSIPPHVVERWVGLFEAFSPQDAPQWLLKAREESANMLRSVRNNMNTSLVPHCSTFEE